MRQAVEHDRNLARLTLSALLGLDRRADQLQPQRPAASNPPPAAIDAARFRTRSHHDPMSVRQKLTIEAATARARWERSRVVYADRHPRRQRKRDRGLRVRSWRQSRDPVFSRNQGGVGRAEAEIERASRQYAAVRAQVVAEVRSAALRVQHQAQQSSPRGATTSCRRSRSSSDRPRAPTAPARPRCSRCSTSAVASWTAAPVSSTRKRISTRADRARAQYRPIVRSALRNIS